MSFQFARLQDASQVVASALAGLMGSVDMWLKPQLAKRPTPSALDQPQIFISYSNKNRAKADRLARQLRARGYTVWYAAHLAPTGPYRLEIDARLNAAQAVIVIWSQASIASEWVLSEAEHAQSQGKLINVRTPEVKRPERELPKPFGVRQVARVADIDVIVSAVDSKMPRGVATKLQNPKFAAADPAPAKLKRHRKPRRK